MPPEGLAAGPGPRPGRLTLGAGEGGGQRCLYGAPTVRLGVHCRAPGEGWEWGAVRCSKPAPERLGPLLYTCTDSGGEKPLPGLADRETEAVRQSNVSPGSPATPVTNVAEREHLISNLRRY